MECIFPSLLNIVRPKKLKNRHGQNCKETAYKISQKQSYKAKYKMQYIYLFPAFCFKISEKLSSVL